MYSFEKINGLGFWLETRKTLQKGKKIYNLRLYCFSNDCFTCHFLSLFFVNNIILEIGKYVITKMNSRGIKENKFNFLHKTKI